MDMEMTDQPPSTLPEPQSPDGQLDHELTRHISTILQTRATREKEQDEEILEILTILDEKISFMKQKEHSRALSFGKALHAFVQKNFIQSTAKKTQHPSCPLVPQWVHHFGAGHGRP